MNDVSPDSNTQPRQLNPGLKIAAIAALVAGVGIGLWALAASLGVWFGLWDFRGGFDMLRTANDWADWIAIAALLITIAIVVASRVFVVRQSGLLIALAALGTVSAALAYFVPESFRPPEGTPPIHDITTDPDNPVAFVDILPLRADAPNTTVYGGSPNMTPERLAELQREAYPEIVPQRFDDPPETVFERALSAVEELGWEIVAQVPEEGRIEATDTTFWFRFKDDVVIDIGREGNETVLNARSLSRVGGSDVGKNAARLRSFFALL
ncbi:MAG: DUF1499 domain-containing protein [Pseudohongiellaceae bacterium]